MNSNIEHCKAYYKADWNGNKSDKYDPKVVAKTKTKIWRLEANGNEIKQEKINLPEVTGFMFLSQKMFISAINKCHSQV